MKCTKCNFEIRQEDRFCPHCGSSTDNVKHCPDCRNECSLNDLFCSTCGHNFSQKQAASAISLAPNEGGNARKHATVLTVDIKDSTQLISNLDPEKAREAIGPALEKMTSIIYEYDGIVLFTAGDGLVAVFGAPEPLEDHALRACLAALAMQKHIPIINASLNLRIGLDSGEVVLSSTDTKSTTIGIPLELAREMEQTAEPGTIRITQHTYKLESNNIEVESLGTQVFKAISDPIEVFKLKTVKASKSFYEWTHQFVDRVAFVGRDKESESINILLESAKKGIGKALGLCGDTGLGKSRLVYEIIRPHLGKECNIFLTAAFIHTRDIPLLPINNLFRYLFGILPRENDLEKAKKLIEPFISQVATPQAHNAILSLISLSSNQPEWASLDPIVKRRYMFEAGSQVLLNYSKEKPLILIFEDVHWIDQESEAFLDRLLSQIGSYKFFLILTYRPQYHDHWIHKSCYTQIILEPLREDSGLKMLNQLLGDDFSLSEIKTKLLNNVGGNPFFLEELVRSLIEEKIFIGGPHKYQLSKSTALHKLHLPETIATIIQLKIDLLKPLEKKLLLIGAVIGKKFLYSQLIQLIEVIDEAEIRGALNSLCKKQYLYEAQLYPELGFAFMYDLTSEIAYNSMLKKTRKELHLKLFQILEQTLHENETDQIQIVAEHAFLGESWEKAFYYSLKGARKVKEINAFSACAKLYENALVAAAMLPPNPELIQQTMLIHYALYYVYVPLGRFAEQHEHLEKALALSLEKKDRLLESLIYSAFCIHTMGYKDVREGLEYANKAYGIAKEIQSKDAIAVAQFALLHVYGFLGQFKQLFATNQELNQTLGGDLDFQSQWLTLPIGHMSLLYECWGRFMIGDYAGIEAIKEGWFATSKNLQEPSIANACRFGGMGTGYYGKGDYEKAIEYLLASLHHSLTSEFVVFVPLCFAMLAHIYLRLNRKDEGKESLMRAIAVSEKLQTNYISLVGTIPISEGLLLLGDYEVAKAYCAKAMGEAKERHVEMMYAMLFRISIEIDLYLPNPNYTVIKQKLEEAVKLLTEFDLQPYVIRCNLSFAEVYKKLGDAEKSKQMLEAALAYYEKMKMSYWIDYTKNLLK